MTNTINSVEILTNLFAYHSLIMKLVHVMHFFAYSLVYKARKSAHIYVEVRHHTGAPTGIWWVMFGTKPHQDLKMRAIRILIEILMIPFHLVGRLYQEEKFLTR